MNLHELAAQPQNHTDKQNADHAFHGRNYLHHYERHFEPLRDKTIKVLEIGVFGGWSLRLWRDYFPKGDIHGLDINPECVDQCKNETRITVHVGDQSDTEVLVKLLDSGPFDIIIDDGSHYVPHMITSFSWLWENLNPGGFYVWEDMGLSYSGIDMSWPGMHLNNRIPEDPFNNRATISSFLESRLFTMDCRQGRIGAIHLYPLIYFFEKV